MREVPEALRQTIRLLVDGEAPWPLFLHGPAGTGKTCAALALLDYAEGEYLTAEGMAARLIESQQGRLTWYKDGHGGNLWPEHVWREYRCAPLVVLDEIGARERVSDHHYDCVKRMLDERDGWPLVVISNMDTGQLVRVYDERVVSRLAAGTVVRLEGEDRRLRR